MFANISGLYVYLFDELQELLYYRLVSSDGLGCKSPYVAVFNELIKQLLLGGNIRSSGNIGGNDLLTQATHLHP
jgi:hypothetical protein